MQVRRQRQAEQELTLKECQQQTEQLQLWLSDIARTLDNATRVNDQSQLQVSITSLEYNFDGLKQMTLGTTDLISKPPLPLSTYYPSTVHLHPMFTLEWMTELLNFALIRTRKSNRLSQMAVSFGGGRARACWWWMVKPSLPVPTRFITNLFSLLLSRSLVFCFFC